LNWKKMKLGTQEHKELFCRSFIDSYLDYEPEKLPWPKLEGVSLERLRGIPFWKEALITEREAGAMVGAFADTIKDPLLKEAIALQAKEESRHARMIEYLINYYEVEISEPPAVVVPDNIETAFIDFGFGECLDSFFAFGMFEIARQGNYLPEPMFNIFNPIIDEEARHIVFFVNWVTYLQIERGQGFSALRSARTLWHYGRALRNLISAFGGAQDKDGKPFTASEASHFMDNLTPELFFSISLQENAKRMSVFDPRLLQPQLMPTLSQFAFHCLKLLPKKQTATKAQMRTSN
jgi:hypothetical protein